MRFTKSPLRFEYRMTDRRIAAARRKLERQVEAMPLFADEVRASQPTPEQVVDNANAAWQKHCANLRANLRRIEAEDWVRGRRRLRLLPAEQQTALLAEWNASRLPGRAVYFLDFLWTRGVR